MNKRFLIGGIVALMLAGCTSYTEIARFPNAVKTDDGEQAIGSIEITNVGYNLFCVIPLVSGRVWQDDQVKYKPHGNAGERMWFEDRCQIDENLKGLKRALKEFPSKRVVNLTSYQDTWNWWSLFVIRRKIIRTNCTVLKAK